MKILSAEWSKNWSWGLIVSEIIKQCGYDVDRVFIPDAKPRVYDVLLSQQVTLFRQWLTPNGKVITRLGGNMTFDEIESSAAKFYLEKMSKCFAVIATNKFLYDVSKKVNHRTYLIPNGINLDVWRPTKNKTTGKNIIVGFVGNINQPAYRKYKGYDMAKNVCSGISGVTFRHALFGDNQIPHEKMMDEFYHKIDVLLHPTAGEGCSNTLMEAAACGVPIITTRCAGYHGELMKHRDNVLFCNRDEQSIGECI